MELARRKSGAYEGPAYGNVNIELQSPIDIKKEPGRRKTPCKYA